MQTTIHGFPKIGHSRELKFALEKYWKGAITLNELEETAKNLRLDNLNFLKNKGLDLIPVGDFSYYDKVLDTCCMVGAVPERFTFDKNKVSRDLYFSMARGIKSDSGNVAPMSMVKWFNTNYHYIVPELSADTQFIPADDFILELVDEALEVGIKAKPVLLGPVSFLLLGRTSDNSRPVELIDRLLPVYEEIISSLAEKGVEWIQLDEPCFATSQIGGAERLALKKAYEKLSAAAGNTKIVVQTYFDHVGENYSTLASLPVQGLGLDFVYGPENLDLLKKEKFPADKTLFAGVVNGRNIWTFDPDKVLSTLKELESALGGKDRVIVSSSCSLMHVPVSREGETNLPDEVFQALSFAKEKVAEIVAVAEEFEGAEISGDSKAVLSAARESISVSRSSSLRHDPEVQKRLTSLDSNSFERLSPYSKRAEAQKNNLGLPLLPTTSIGSFPQTVELRKARARFRKGELSRDEYENTMREDIRNVIKLQEELDIDVLVHGEPERNDMVEYFGEQLSGYYFTKNGWVVSYGSRCVKPPIIYGDVSRPEPMTVEWAKYAQSQSERPVKGMLTGPVTILNWSFVREDIPRRETCLQIGLAIRDETVDLESAGIKVIQIDEPALREGLPLQEGKQKEYLDWSVDAYKLSQAGVQDGTQIHTHMCYSDFNTIIEEIIRMDADVISMENSRAKGLLLKVFREREYPNEIGPGVYDIHSPLVPETDEMVAHLREILEVLPKERVWVNPDCGLKTRNYEEVNPSLKNMVEAAKIVRKEIGA